MGSTESKGETERGESFTADNSGSMGYGLQRKATFHRKPKVWTHKEDQQMHAK